MHTRCNIAHHARSLVTILAQASNTDQRLTGLKLVDAWLGRGGSVALRVPGLAPPKGLDRAGAEGVVVQLILGGYLKEDFHFTPYNTISYLLPGNLYFFLCVF